MARKANDEVQKLIQELSDNLDYYKDTKPAITGEIGDDKVDFELSGVGVFGEEAAKDVHALYESIQSQLPEDVVTNLDDLVNNLHGMAKIAQPLWGNKIDDREKKRIQSQVIDIMGDLEGLTEDIIAALKSGSKSITAKYFEAGYKAGLKATKAMKSSADDIDIESADDLDRVKQKAVDISERWVSIAWGATPEGSKKDFTFYFNVVPFDIKYTCVLTIDKYAEPDSWADGRIISKWDDDGAGWPQGIGNTDINGSLLTVGTDRAKHPPYGIEDGATPIEWMITHLCDFFNKSWEALEDSDAKSIRSVKHSIKLDPNDVNVQITNMLNGYLKYLSEIEELFYKEVGDPTTEDLNKLDVWGEKAADDLFDLCAENSDEIVGQVSKDLVRLCRELPNVSLPVHNYLAGSRVGADTDEFEMQRKTLEWVFDMQRQIQKIMTQLDYK